TESFTNQLQYIEQQPLSPDLTDTSVPAQTRPWWDEVGVSVPRSFLGSLGPNVPFHVESFDLNTGDAVSLGGTITPDPGPGTLDHFEIVSVDGMAVAVPKLVRIVAEDKDGNPTDLPGSLAVTSTDRLAQGTGEVTTTPADDGSKTIEVTFNTPGSQTITVTGGGVTSTSDAILVLPGGGFSYQLDPPSFHYGVVLPGGSATNQGTFTNTGDSPLFIGGFTPFSPNLTIDPGSCIGLLAPGSPCNYYVTLAGVAAGPNTAFFGIGIGGGTTTPVPAGAPRAGG